MDNVQRTDVTLSNLDLAQQAATSAAADIGEMVEKEAAELKKVRDFIADCAALKDQLYNSIGPLTREWKEKGLDSTFFECNDERSQTRLDWRISFVYPFHERVDLMHGDQKLDADYAPFVTYAVTMVREDAAVVVKHREINPKVRTPYLAGAPRFVAPDADAVKKEMDFLVTARDCARAAVEKLNEAVRNYCSGSGKQMVERPVEVTSRSD